MDLLRVYTCGLRHPLTSLRGNAQHHRSVHQLQICEGERELALRCTTAATQDSPELVRSRDSLQESSNTILFRSSVHHVRLVSVFAERLAFIEYVALVGYFFHEDTRQDVFIHECHVAPTTAPERMNTSISLRFSCVTLEEFRKVNFPYIRVCGRAIGFVSIAQQLNAGKGRTSVEATGQEEAEVTGTPRRT